MVETKSTDQEKDLIVNIYHMDSYEINVVTCKMTYNIYIYIFMMIYKYISNTMYMYTCPILLQYRCFHFCLHVDVIVIVLFFKLLILHWCFDLDDFLFCCKETVHSLFFNTCSLIKIFHNLM